MLPQDKSSFALNNDGNADPKTLTAASSSTAWTEHVSKEGRTYYHNRDTGVTTWEKPDELKTPQERASVWKEYSKDGRSYWYNSVTRRSTWTKPDELVGPAETKGVLDADYHVSATSSVYAAGPHQSQRPSAPSRDTALSPQLQPAIERSLTSIPPASAPMAVPVPGPRPMFRPPPPVPPIKALEAIRKPQREYRTAEEAEAVFLDMLKAHKVSSEWSWEQTLRTVVNDPDYRALRTAHERKDAFYKYIDRLREQEREQRRQQLKQRREDFFKILDTLPVTEFTRYRKIKHLAKDLPQYTVLLSDSEGKQFFDEYMDNLVRDLKDTRDQVRDERLKEVADYLKDIGISSRWPEIRTRLTQRFQDFLMPVLQSADNSSHMPMDTLYYISDANAVDPEAGLSFLDLMEAFERAMVDTELRDADARKKDKDAMFRRERQNRDKFCELLEEHQSLITPVSTWAEFYPVIKGDQRYINMLGQPGSSPLELFWDKVELLNEDVYHDRKRIEAAMRDHRFKMNVDTSLQQVKEFVEEHCAVAETHLEYIHQQLVIKAKRRKEEEEERAERHRKRLLDDFKYALYDLEPPVGPESVWDQERARIEKLPEYRDIEDREEDCRGVFEHVVQRAKEKAEQRRKRRDSESRKRSRSPANDRGYLDHDSGERSKVARQDGNTSELEEGEMVL
ncbi:U1 snRNP protein [Coemansia sp. RSA 1286]|nr:U1 snRNP protein [Coemansia sp. RSA 1286]